MTEPTEILIRKATLKDLPEIQQLSNDLITSDAQFDQGLKKEWSFSEDGKKYLTSRIKGRKGTCFVAESKGKIVGYLTGGIRRFEKWRPFKRAELDNIFIQAGFRSQGIGKELIGKYLDWCQSKGVERVFLHAVDANQRARKFYKTHGFHEQHIILEKNLK